MPSDVRWGFAPPEHRFSSGAVPPEGVAQPPRPLVGRAEPFRTSNGKAIGRQRYQDEMMSSSAS